MEHGIPTNSYTPLLCSFEDGLRLVKLRGEAMQVPPSHPPTSHYDSTFSIRIRTNAV